MPIIFHNLFDNLHFYLFIYLPKVLKDVLSKIKRSQSLLTAWVDLQFGFGKSPMANTCPLFFNKKETLFF